MTWLDSYALGLLLFLFKGWLLLRLVDFILETQYVCSATLRHRCRAMTLSLIPLLPVVSMLVPAWVPASLEFEWPQEVDTDIASNALQNDSGAGVFSWWHLLLLLYAVVALGIALRLLLSHLIAAGLVLGSRRWTAGCEAGSEASRSVLMAGAARLRVSRWISTPATFGLLQPVIILPACAIRWPTGKLALIIAHEQQHVLRHDWWWQSIAQVALALLWPVPSVWRHLKSLSLEAEQACDDGVLAMGGDPIEYAELLMCSSQNVYGAALVGFGNRNVLLARVSRILDVTADRSEWRKSWLLSPIWLLLLLPLSFVNAGVAVPSPMDTWRYISIASCDECGVVQHQVALDDPLPNLPSVPPDVLRPPRIPSSGVFFEASQFSERFPIPAPDLDIDLSGFSVSMSGARALRTVMPEYPRPAIRRGIEGWVLAICDVGVDGSVIAARIVQSLPKGVFEDVSTRALLQFRFEPMSDVSGLASGQRSVITRFVFQRSTERPQSLPILFSGTTALTMAPVDYLMLPPAHR